MSSTIDRSRAKGLPRHTRLEHAFSFFGTRTPRAATACAAVFVVLVIVAGDARWLSTLCISLPIVVAVLGLNISQGESGMFSLATGAFMAIGAYSTAIMTTRYEWSMLAAAGLGVLLAAVIASVFALLTLRVSEIYLAIATLALAQIVAGVILAGNEFTNGVDGIPGVPAPSLFGYEFYSVWQMTLFNFAVMTVLAIGIALLLDSRPGRAFRAVREDELAASGVGIRTNRALNLSFTLAAIFASIAGSLLAHSLAFMDPASVGMDIAVMTVAMLVLGGAGSVVGAIVGVLLLQFADQLMSDLHGYADLLYGLVILGTAILAPKGIVGSFTQVVDRIPRLRRASGAARTTQSDLTQLDLDSGAAVPLPFRDTTLVASGISKSFGGVHALHEMSLVVKPGQVHALIGPNGSGKSTFINTMSGIYQPDKGSVSLDGRRLDGQDASGRPSHGVARTYQNGRLFSALTVHENVAIAADHRPGRAGILGERLPGISGREWVETVIDFVGIRSVENARAGDLGFGSQRKVELARALALDPTFLMLDEPAAGLSKLDKQELVVNLDRLRRLGMGLLLVEHSMEVVMELADVMTVIDFGAVIAHGRPGEVRADQGVIDAYLGVS